MTCAQTIHAPHLHRVETAEVESLIISDPTTIDVDYYYGGCRKVPPETTFGEMHHELTRLMTEESGIKNAVINQSLRRVNFAAAVREQLPPGFMDSRVAGGRCIIRAKDHDVDRVLSDPNHPEFEDILDRLFANVGRLLDSLGGRIKLTPDFGRYHGVADLLHKHTAHVLGIRWQAGGCGGKASYTATGIQSVMEQIGFATDKPVTLIGADGALGRHVCEYLQRVGVKDLALSDLAYDSGRSQPAPGANVLPATPGRFTPECLVRSGTIVATTVGHELENSPWELIPPGSRIFLAHNLAFPEGELGIKLSRKLAQRDVFLVPGQLLTFGGALTSRLEWYHRQTTNGAPFEAAKKQLAHHVVRSISEFVARETLHRAINSNVTPYEALLELARQDY